jgi:predicted lipid-binding transport protein (Tim44 family)
MLFLLIGLVILMLVGFVMRRRLSAPALQGAGAGNAPLPQQRLEPQPMQRTSQQAPSDGARPGSAMDHFLRGGAVNPDTPWGIPAGFDVDGFVSNARMYFGKLQDAWRTGNLDEIADFTTNDMFIALTHELRARGAAPTSVAIDTMDARLLGIESTPAEHIASVRFTGTLRIDGEHEAVDEVWNLSKAADGKSGWLLAGIQQIS